MWRLPGRHLHGVPPRFFTAVLDLLAPCQCDLCEMPSRRDIDLCLPCEGELPWLVTCCRQCALPLPGGGPLCGRCLRAPPAFDRCIAACCYAEPVSGWIHAAKYRGDISRLGILAHLLGRCLSAALPEETAPDLLVPMPLHWRRRWRRGFNQAGILAQHLAAQPRLAGYHLRVADGLCRRITATPTQRGLDAAARRRNLRGAFRCEQALHGKTVAIVDDVLTTGASASELAMTLKASGASAVYLWCCARTAEPG